MLAPKTFEVELVRTSYRNGTFIATSRDEAVRIAREQLIPDGEDDFHTVGFVREIK